MKLKIAERIQLTRMLPMQGDFETLVLSKSAIGKIEITSAEVEEFEMKTIDGLVNWNEKGVASIVDITLTKKERELVIDTLKKVNAEKKLPMDLIDIYADLVKK